MRRTGPTDRPVREAAIGVSQAVPLRRGVGLGEKLDGPVPRDDQPERWHRLSRLGDRFDRLHDALVGTHLPEESRDDAVHGKPEDAASGFFRRRGDRDVDAVRYHRKQRAQSQGAMGASGWGS